jgi:hypothetical protein
VEKIPTIFERDWNAPGHPVIDQINPACQWVFDGEGIPTRKFDGTCMLYVGPAWWFRREVKPGKTAPEGYREVARDEETGKSFGWEPATENHSYWKPFREALESRVEWEPFKTYELVGPKVNGNPERLNCHYLVLHGANMLSDLPVELTFDKLRDYFLYELKEIGREGIVWHHSDGRMAKLKVRDFK